MTEQKIQEIAEIMEKIEREEIEKRSPIDLGYDPQEANNLRFYHLGHIPKGYL